MLLTPAKEINILSNMIDWHTIDTVLLDMDGTLLDLHFDNYFWLSYLPKRYAEHHDLCPDQATRDLHATFNEKRGTLDWYCLDYWTQQLAVDIRSLKEEIQHLIKERPHALHFLSALKGAHKQRVLITNAHRRSLDLKLSLTGIGQHLDMIISSHDYGFPKESREFWLALQQNTGFDPERTLFIDDSLSVLGAAQEFGVGFLLAISQPDSQLPPTDTTPFTSIAHFDEILPEKCPTNG